MTETSDQPASTPDGQKKPRRKHRIIVVLLLIIGTLLTPITILALFVHTEVSDTDRYVQNVAPLASNPAIQAYVADDVTNRLFDNADVKAYVQDALPPKAQKLVDPIRGVLKTFVHDATLKLLQSPQFQKLWEQANRFAHAQLDHVLTGAKNPAVVHSPNGTVSIDLSQVVSQVTQRLQDSGIDLFKKIPIVKVGGQIPIFQSKDLYQIRGAVGLFNKIAYLLPFLVLACFGGAIYLSRNRRKGFLAAAICFGLGALVVALLLAVGRTVYLNAATNAELPQNAAAAVYDTLVRFLHTSVRAALIFSVVVIIAVFFSGPSRAAEAFRRWVRQSTNWLGAQSDQAGWGWLGAIPFVVAHKKAMRITVAVVAFAVLFRWKHPTPMVIFSAAVIVLALLALIEFFGREPTVSEPATLQAQTA